MVSSRGIKIGLRRHGWGSTGQTSPGVFLSTMAGVVLLPLMIKSLIPTVIDPIWQCFKGAAYFILPLAAVFLMAGKFGRRMPSGTVPGTKPEHARFPVVSVSLMAVCTMVFCVSPAIDVNRIAYLASEDFELLHLVLTTLTRTFVHTDSDCFYINMSYLFILGVILESRLGPGRYLTTVLFGSILASLIRLNILLTQADFLDASFHLFRNPPEGVSGAIAALMGLCVMNRRLARPSGGPPLPRRPFFLLPAPVIGLGGIGFFFIRDFSGRAVSTGMADYWGHLAGFLGGLALALVFAIQENDHRDMRGIAVECPGGASAGDTVCCHDREVPAPDRGNLPGGRCLHRRVSAPAYTVLQRR